MGIFSDYCPALIDPQTGRALTGSALQEAEKDAQWPRCGNQVRKAARFCGKCGRGAPGGWWKCPSCRKWVGNDSSFCWNCKAPLHPESRDMIAGGVWQKPAHLFAARFEVDNIRKLLGRGLTVQTGTAAVLMDGGRVRDVIGPGRHNLESMARSINHWGSAPPRSVILLDSGEAGLPLRLEGLRSAEEMQLELFSEIIIQFNPRRAGDLVANLMKQSFELRYEDLLDRLQSEARYAVDAVCVSTPVDDLVKDPGRRLYVEDELRSALNRTLESSGLELVRVSAVEFIGPEYEQLREKAGRLEEKRRHLEFDQRLRELLSRDRMSELKSEHDLEQYVNQLAQERDISAEHRDFELNRLKQVHRHEMDREEAAWQMAREMERAAHEIQVKLQWDDHTRDRLVRDAGTQASVREIQVDAEVAEAMKWLDVRKRKQEVGREDQQAVLEMMRGHDLQTLIAGIDDPARRRDLLEMSRRLQQAGQSPEQILASAAAGDPQAARALEAVMKAKSENRDRDISEQRQIHQEYADRLERVMKAALESGGKGKGGDVHIVR